MLYYTIVNKNMILILIMGASPLCPLYTKSIILEDSWENSLTFVGQNNTLHQVDLGEWLLIYHYHQVSNQLLP